MINNILQTKRERRGRVEWGKGDRRKKQGRREEKGRWGGKEGGLMEVSRVRSRDMGWGAEWWLGTQTARSFRKPWSCHFPLPTTSSLLPSLAPFPKSCCAKSQSYLNLCYPADCSQPGFSLHGLHQASVLEWVAISFFKISACSSPNQGIKKT